MAVAVYQVCDIYELNLNYFPFDEFSGPDHNWDSELPGAGHSQTGDGPELAHQGDQPAAQTRHPSQCQVEMS